MKKITSSYPAVCSTSGISFFGYLTKKYNKQQVKTFLFLISTSSNMVRRKTIMRLMASYNYFKCRGWATHPILESFKPNPELVLLFG